MPIKIDYKKSVLKDLKNIGNPVAKRLVDKLETELSTNPDKGIPLHGEFKGLFKLRIGDYRIIYAKSKERVLILRIGHRSTVYR